MITRGILQIWRQTDMSDEGDSRVLLADDCQADRQTDKIVWLSGLEVAVDGFIGCTRLARS